MKKFLLLVLLQSAFVTFLSAQEKHVCGTPHTPSKWTEDYLRDRGAYAKSNELLYVPLTVHAVGTDDGTGYIRVRSILDALCTLNEAYAAANIQFYLNGAIRYINNSTLYDLKGLGSGDLFLRQNRVANSINCYLVGTIESSDGGDILGFANGIPSSEVVLRNATITSGDPTLIHEMGHALGLYHTFYGWEEFEHNYQQNAPLTVNYGRPVELLDKTNCAGAGDGLCDTPADYLGERWACTRDGQSSVVQRDPSGATFRSDGKNYMSYADDNCVNTFSAEQIQMMRTNLTTQKRTFLNRQQPVPSIDSLTVTLLSPRQNDTVAFTSALTLNWTAVPDATNYILEVSRFASFNPTFTETYLLTTNVFTLTNLVNNRNYFWRIRAFNRNSFCTKSSTTGIFRAGMPTTTPTDDLVDKVSLQIFPNPIASNQSLTIQAALPKSTRLNVRLYDLSGKLLQTAAYDVIAGANTLRFTPNYLPKGIYVMNLVTDEINIVERILIQ